MLSCSESSEERTMLWGSIPWVTWIDDHASDIGHGPVDLWLVETVWQSGMHGVFINKLLVQGNWPLWWGKSWSGFSLILICLTKHPWVQVLTSIAPRLCSLLLNFQFSILIKPLPLREHTLDASCTWVVAILHSEKLWIGTLMLASRNICQLITLLVHIEWISEILYMIFHARYQFIIRLRSENWGSLSKTRWIFNDTYLCVICIHSYLNLGIIARVLLIACIPIFSFLRALSIVPGIQQIIWILDFRRKLFLNKLS